MAHSNDLRHLANTPRMVRVWPTEEKYRPALRHPSAGPLKPTGGTSWPADQFTNRRILEGVLAISEPPSTEKKGD